MAVLRETELARRAADLEWVIFDVDGVLTDGGLYYDRRGHGFLRFDVKDGLGIRLAQRAGLRVGLLSGRGGPALERRADELDIDWLATGVHDKAEVFDRFLSEHSASPARVAFVGDDLPDLVVLGRCGLSFAPADAVAAVRAVVHVVLQAAGGRGAGREVIEILLRARGDWDEVFASFTFDR